MDVWAARCAGLDVHQRTIMACALVGEARRRVSKLRSEFATTARGLAALAAWLQEHGIGSVVMEATGVYWMPVYATLEACGGFDLVVANAQHVKAVPGRKTDVKDAEWLAALGRHGLVRKSFIPDHPFRVLCDLTRFRRTLVEDQASERRRLIKLLESADVKLASVVSDVFGLSGRAMLRALIAGEVDPAVLADLARGTLRKKRDALREALAAPLKDHQRKILAIQLGKIEAVEAAIAALDIEIRAGLAPYADTVDRLITIPGIDWIVAATVVAEIGTDLSSFPSAAHLAAWAGTCPGSRDSAGHRKPTGARKGNPHLKTALCNAAIAASRTRGTSFKAKYHKLKSRIGAGKAALAIAHKLIVCIFNMLTRNEPYRELGEAYLDKIDVKTAARRLVQRLEGLGFSVNLAPSPTPPPL